MKIKYIGIVIMLIISLFLLTGCNENEENVNNVATTTSKTNESSEKSNNQSQKESDNTQNEIDLEKFDYKTAAENQMSMPKEGETVAIIKVKGFGEMKVKFFEKVAPKAVENFTTHAKNGYYNGVTFHRVINEFMIQGGDPTGTGFNGESIWGTGFGTEIAPELVPYRGSLCMAMSSQPNSIGSQFFITQANYSQNMENMLKSGGYPNGLLEQYKDYGGYLSLYLQYTVFGQVYEGLDVLDKIAAVKTGSVPLVIDGVNYGNQDDKPLEDVIIENIEITTYKTN